MKLKALKNFWLKDAVRGQMLAVKKGSEFEMTEKTVEDLQGIDELITSLLAEPIDVVPETNRYICRYSFIHEGYEGSPGEIIILPEKIGINLMARGFVRPEDPRDWYPGKKVQLEKLIQKTPVKKMFDTVDDLIKAERGGQ